MHRCAPLQLPFPLLTARCTPSSPLPPTPTTGTATHHQHHRLPSFPSFTSPSRGPSTTGSGHHRRWPDAGDCTVHLISPAQIWAVNRRVLGRAGQERREQGDGRRRPDHPPGSRRQPSGGRPPAVCAGPTAPLPQHPELVEPTIKEAFGKCVQQGASRIIVSPYFLSPGRHWKQDIPSLAAEASKEHSNVAYIVTAPLGLHELMVDVMNDRIKYCLRHVVGDADECAVCAGTGKCHLYS